MHVGGAICASFIVFGGLGIAFYKPWRSRIDGMRGVHRQPPQSRAGGEAVELGILASHEPTKDLEQGQEIIHSGPQHSPAQESIDCKGGGQVVVAQ